jgi:hypothetical protein
VRHEQRQGVLVRRADVRELDVQSVDLGDELGQLVERRLDLAPVVVGAPVLDERLELRQLDALGPVADGLLVRPACRRDAPAEIDELLLWNVDAEGADCGFFPNWTGHGGLLSVDRASLGNDRSILLGKEDVCLTQHKVL